MNNHSMLNFTVGPVQTDEMVCSIGAEQVPYFRTPEFSDIVLENERLMKKFAGTGENAQVFFITSSGTGCYGSNSDEPFYKRR